MKKEGDFISLFPLYLPPMNTRLGVHVGTKDKIPETEQERKCLIASALTWQEHNGPIVMVLDEAFYIWLYHHKLEALYVDIIPIEMEYKTEEDVREHFKQHIPYTLYFVGLNEISIPEGEGKTYLLEGEKDFVDLQLEVLTQEYR